MTKPAERRWEVTAYRNTLTVAICVCEGVPSAFADGAMAWRARWTPYAFKGVYGHGSYRDAKQRAEKVVALLNDRPLTLQVVTLEDNPMPKLRELVIQTMREVDRNER